MSEAVADAGGDSAAIWCAALTRVFSRRRDEPIVALDRIDLRVERGTMVALLGPNGSGKSTLLRLASGLDRADAGGLTVLGERVDRQGRWSRRGLGVVFQQPGLDHLLTVRENLLAEAGLRGVAPGAVDTALAEAGLAARAHDRVGVLSGGLRRRVDLARALLARPELLLLDEPMTGLDPEARQAFLDLLFARRAVTPECTIVIATHMLDVAERADRVVLLAGGRILADGAPRTLRASLGAMHLRTTDAAAEVLGRAGITARSTSDGVRVHGDTADIRRAADLLLQDGLAFDAGPPTLADVYAEHAGAPLEADP